MSSFGRVGAGAPHADDVGQLSADLIARRTRTDEAGVDLAVVLQGADLSGLGLASVRWGGFWRLAALHTLKLGNNLLGAAVLPRADGGVALPASSSAVGGEGPGRPPAGSPVSATGAAGKAAIAALGLLPALQRLHLEGNGIDAWPSRAELNMFAAACTREGGWRPDESPASSSSSSPPPVVLFPRLEHLDLSYNALGGSSGSARTLFSVVTTLPGLRHLDISRNGLATLPPSLHACLPRLEVLIADANKLQRPEDLLALAKLPRLQRLSLAKNYFSDVPEECVAPFGAATATATAAANSAARKQQPPQAGFPALRFLSLAYNYLGPRTDFGVLLRLPLLDEVHVFGTPAALGAVDLQGRLKAEDALITGSMRSIYAATRPAGAPAVPTTPGPSRSPSRSPSPQRSAGDGSVRSPSPSATGGSQIGGFSGGRGGSRGALVAMGGSLELADPQGSVMSSIYGGGGGAAGFFSGSPVPGAGGGAGRTGSPTGRVEWADGDDDGADDLEAGDVDIAAGLAERASVDIDTVTTVRLMARTLASPAAPSTSPQRGAGAGAGAFGGPAAPVLRGTAGRTVKLVLVDPADATRKGGPRPPSPPPPPIVLTRGSVMADESDFAPPAAAQSPPAAAASEASEGGRVVPKARAALSMAMATLRQSRGSDKGGAGLGATEVGGSGAAPTTTTRPVSRDAQLEDALRSTAGGSPLNRSRVLSSAALAASLAPVEPGSTTLSRASVLLTSSPSARAFPQTAAGTASSSTTSSSLSSPERPLHLRLNLSPPIARTSVQQLALIKKNQKIEIGSTASMRSHVDKALAAAGYNPPAATTGGDSATPPALLSPRRYAILSRFPLPGDALPPAAPSPGRASPVAGQRLLAPEVGLDDGTAADGVASVRALYAAATGRAVGADVLEEKASRHRAKRQAVRHATGRGYYSEGKHGGDGRLDGGSTTDFVEGFLDYDDGPGHLPAVMLEGGWAQVADGVYGGAAAASAGFVDEAKLIGGRSVPLAAVNVRLREAMDAAFRDVDGTDNGPPLDDGPLDDGGDSADDGAASGRSSGPLPPLASFREAFAAELSAAGMPDMARTLLASARRDTSRVSRAEAGSAPSSPRAGGGGASSGAAYAAGAAYPSSSSPYGSRRDGGAAGNGRLDGGASVASSSVLLGGTVLGASTARSLLATSNGGGFGGGVDPSLLPGLPEGAGNHLLYRAAVQSLKHALKTQGALYNGTTMMRTLGPTALQKARQRPMRQVLAAGTAGIDLEGSGGGGPASSSLSGGRPLPYSQSLPLTLSGQISRGTMGSMYEDSVDVARVGSGVLAGLGNGAARAAVDAVASGALSPTPGPQSSRPGSRAGTQRTASRGKVQTDGIGGAPPALVVATGGSSSGSSGGSSPSTARAAHPSSSPTAAAGPGAGTGRRSPSPTEKPSLKEARARFLALYAAKKKQAAFRPVETLLAPLPPREPIYEGGAERSLVATRAHEGGPPTRAAYRGVLAAAAESSASLAAMARLLRAVEEPQDGALAALLEEDEGEGHRGEREGAQESRRVLARSAAAGLL
jgi:hypothetical protein